MVFGKVTWCYSISCRLSVLSAITSVQQRLKLYSKGWFSRGSVITNSWCRRTWECLGLGVVASTPVLGPCNPIFPFSPSSSVHVCLPPSIHLMLGPSMHSILLLSLMKEAGRKRKSSLSVISSEVTAIYILNFVLMCLQGIMPVMFSPF